MKTLSLDGLYQIHIETDCQQENYMVCLPFRWWTGRARLTPNHITNAKDTTYNFINVYIYIFFLNPAELPQQG